MLTLQRQQNKWSKKTLEQVEYISGTYNQNDSRTSDGTEQSDKRPSEHWNNSSPKTAFLVILFW